MMDEPKVVVRFGRTDVGFLGFCAWLSVSVAVLTYAVCMFLCRSGVHL